MTSRCFDQSMVVFTKLSFEYCVEVALEGVPSVVAVKGAVRSMDANISSGERIFDCSGEILAAATISLDFAESIDRFVSVGVMNKSLEEVGASKSPKSSGLDWS